LVRACA